jgi:hypothetical protein
MVVTNMRVFVSYLVSRYLSVPGLLGRSLCQIHKLVHGHGPPLRFLVGLTVNCERGPLSPLMFYTTVVEALCCPHGRFRFSWNDSRIVPWKSRGCLILNQYECVVLHPSPQGGVEDNWSPHGSGTWATVLGCSRCTTR